MFSVFAESVKKGVYEISYSPKILNFNSSELHEQLWRTDEVGTTAD